MDRTKLKGYGALVLVFALGILIGGAGSRAMLQARYKRFFREPSAMFDGRRFGALSHRLKLDDAQEERARDIFGKYGKQRRALTRDIMNRCGEPLHAQRSDGRRDSRAPPTGSASAPRPTDQGQRGPFSAAGWCARTDALTTYVPSGASVANRAARRTNRPDGLKPSLVALFS